MSWGDCWQEISLQFCHSIRIWVWSNRILLKDTPLSVYVKSAAIWIRRFQELKAKLFSVFLILSDNSWCQLFMKFRQKFHQIDRFVSVFCVQWLGVSLVWVPDHLWQIRNRLGQRMRVQRRLDFGLFSGSYWLHWLLLAVFFLSWIDCIQLFWPKETGNSNELPRLLVMVLRKWQNFHILSCDK